MNASDARPLTASPDISLLATPLREAAAAKRQQPTAQIVDDVNAARDVIAAAQGQRATIEAFRETKVNDARKAFDTREAERQRQIAAAQLQIANLQVASQEDADDMRATLREVTLLAETQIGALDKRIVSHQNLIKDLTS